MTTEILYFANPFCSWCWGFVPVVEEVRTARPDLQISVVTGRLGVNDQGPLSPKARTAIGEHWQHVTELTGQQFDHNVLARPELTYDTAPSCQALMLVRQTYPALAHPFMARLAERFFLEGVDLTDPAELGQIAGDFGFEPETVEAALVENEYTAEIDAEWRQTENLGVTGYPTLIKLADGKVDVLTIGYTSASEILSRLPPS